MREPHEGRQRLPLEKLKAWEALGYGMFIHFGMSTFSGVECDLGEAPSDRYAPDRLDVRQWVAVARDAGMKYAVLSTKHVAGFCNWPSRHTDYHVGNSPCPVDVVAAFARACADFGLMAGLYYCSWDNHHRFGSRTPNQVAQRQMLGPSNETYAYTTTEYLRFQTAQLEELLTQYGPIGEVWIDIPAVLPRNYRNDLYAQIARWQPDALVMMNNGFGNGVSYPEQRAWPSDLISMERDLPNSNGGHDPWREIEDQWFYVPGEVCDPIGRDWFHVDGDRPRADVELLGMFLVCRSRRANLLLDVPPNRHGLIGPDNVAALSRLRANVQPYFPL